jgi:hypothetical protein
MERFSLIRVRSPLLTESLLFSLPAGTEMFHFPAFPPRTLCVQMRVTRHSRPWRGFPIRTPWDHSPVIDSPRLIADSYVLLRLLMPRHPPCALKNLTTKDQKTFFERTTKTNHNQKAAARSRFIFLEIASYKRCSRPLCSSQTTTPNHTPHTFTCTIGAARKPETNKPGTKPRSCCLRTQQCAKHYPPPQTTSVPEPTLQRRSARTNKRSVPPGTYLLIFHP